MDAAAFAGMARVKSLRARECYLHISGGRPST